MKQTVMISMGIIIATLLIAGPLHAGNGRGKQSGAGANAANRNKDWGGETGFRGHRGDPVAWMIRQLELTPEQETSIRDLYETHRKTTDPILEKMRNLHREIRLAWQAETPDEGAIIELHREIHAIRGELAELRIQLRIDTMAILTPAQREKMRAGFVGRGKRFGKGRGFGGHGPGGGFGPAGGPGMDDEGMF